MRTPTWSTGSRVLHAVSHPRLEPDASARRLVRTLEAHGLLTFRALVLAWVVRDEALRVKDLCAQLNLTERTVRGHLASLVDAGLLRCVKRGRRNVYVVDHDVQRDVAALGTVGGAPSAPTLFRLLGSHA